MGSMSIWHWIIVLAVGLLLFGGRGKISELMGDFAKGIKSFKKGLSEEEKPEAEAAKPDQMRTIDHQPGQSTTAPGAPVAGSAPASGSEPRKAV
jgi:sec-independent protein translocase protein TatA